MAQTVGGLPALLAPEAGLSALGRGAPGVRTHVCGGRCAQPGAGAGDSESARWGHAEASFWVDWDDWPVLARMATEWTTQLHPLLAGTHPSPQTTLLRKATLNTS